VHTMVTAERIYSAGGCLECRLAHKECSKADEDLGIQVSSFKTINAVIQGSEGYPEY